MVDASYPGRAIVQRAGLTSGQRHQFRQRVHAQARMGGPYQRSLGEHAHRREITQGVVACRGQGRRHRGERGRRQQQGVTVRRALGHGLGTDGARGPHPVFHHHTGPQYQRQLLGDQSPHRVGAGTGGKGHHHPDRARWERVCV